MRFRLEKSQGQKGSFDTFRSPNSIIYPLIQVIEFSFRLLNQSLENNEISGVGYYTDRPSVPAHN